jgi:hypothetical protein
MMTAQLHIPRAGRWPLFGWFAATLIVITGRGPPPLSAQPLATAQTPAAVSTADVHRFIEALHRLAPADSACAPFEEYFRAASPRLRTYRSRFGVGPSELCAAVRRSPERYAAIEAKLPAIDSASERIDSVFARFKLLVPDAKVRPVYFVVGNGISGGTTTHGLHPVGLIGVELLGGPQGIPGSVAHEFVHTLQDYPWIGMPQAGPSFIRGTLLRNCIMEGSASFLADVVTGSHWRNEWAEAHEGELWTEFERALHGKDYSRWLYNRRVTKPGERPGDLGYFIGYRITETYYNRASDKSRAIHEILTIRDFDRFLRDSGYDGPASK